MPIEREEARKKLGPNDMDIAESKEIARLRRTNKELRKKAGDMEWLLEHMSTMAQQMGVLPPVSQAPRILPKDMAQRRVLHPILTITDAHLEEVVDPEETDGITAYNFDIFLRRLQRVCQATIDIVSYHRTSHIIDNLDIFFLGDMVTGEIHPDVFFSNDFYLPEALTRGPWYIAQAVRDLSAHFVKVRNSCVAGNHGRLDKKPVSKKAVRRNWDTCLYQSSAIHCMDLDNVEWFIPRSSKCVIDILGWYFLLQHGDKVPQSGGITPYYGIARQRAAEMVKRMGFRVRDLDQKIREGKIFDYDWRGHHHLYGIIDEKTFLCPALIGNNEFGLDRIFANKTPGARLTFIDEDHGVAGDYRINFHKDLPEHTFVKLPDWHMPVRREE